MIAAVRTFKLRPVHVWLAVLAFITGIGAVAGIIVFSEGLYLTNMTDLVPWGLWITIDLSSIALSAGAFSLCAVVYILGLKQYQSVARTATYIGLIGYTMAMFTLLLDIGRPDRFWHYLVFWNTHSVLWEVSMCLTLYLMVLLLETMPIIGGIDFVRSRWPKLSARLEHVHHYAPILAIAGLFLSMLHQSSLGATFGVILAKPIWYRPGLSVLFIISAVAGGISLTVLLSMLASRLNRKIKVKDHVLENLAMVVGWILVGYLYFRFWDAFSMTYTYEPGRTEGLALLTKGPLALNFWLGEIILGALVPIILLLNPRTRSLPWVRMLALAMVVGGVVAYRWDTTLVGSMVILSYTPNAVKTLYTSYVPSLIEILAGGGVIAFGMLAITIGMQYFNIVDHGEVQLESVQEEVYALGSAD